jgi:flavin-dependent dehydrogenase
MAAMYDVAVVGAGPAGSATAIHLARAGLDVVLIDRARFPRRKACGEGVFPAGVAELEKLGVLAAVQGQAAELNSIRFEGYGRAAAAPLGRPTRRGLGLSRLLLDAALVSAAGSAGVDVESCRVKKLLGGEKGYRGIATSEGEVEARVIVGADGLNSRLRREAGLHAGRHRRRFGISAHVLLRESAGSAVHVYFEPGAEIYLTPTGDRSANIAVLTGQNGIHRVGGHLGEAFAAAVAHHPALQAGFELCDEPMAAGPFPAACSRAWNRNLVLTGDAAGFFDGISGEGVSLALASAQLCATAVQGYLVSGDEGAFVAYDRERRARAQPSELLARLSLALAGRPFLARRALAALGKNSRVFARLVAVNCGDLPLSSLRPGDIAALMGGMFTSG